MPVKSIYTEKLALEICYHIAEGLSLRHIEALEGMPTKTTMMRWCLENDAFRDQYTRAKEQQADAFAEEMLDIVDDSRNDWVERENSRNGTTFVALNEEAISRARLRAETRKWLMGKMRPKKYGEKSSIELTGKDGEAIEVKTKLDDEINSRIIELTTKIGAVGITGAARGKETKGNKKEPS